MTSTKLHPSLPAPVVHLSHIPPSHSKSHVLAGVQDAYWSDDEAEDRECPLCLEEMDISDLNFKPCPCGYQVCRFCWHHIKENLNGRCPACRKDYSDEAVQFKAIAKEDHKRITQQKKQRDKERKELDALGRRHLVNVRVVQRNVVYVVGIGSRFAKEELIPTLRSHDYFGQYGKISKILIVKRTPPGSRTPVVGLYITYHRREDAARAIGAVDGGPSPSGGNEVMRASYGTTKYCMAFLRSVSCTSNGCMDLHEWGDEKDCFTKEDLTTLKHTMKDTETRQRTVVSSGDGPLPRTAAWPKSALGGSSSMSNNGSSGLGSRSTRRGNRPPRSGTSTTTNDSRPQPVLPRAQNHDRKPNSSHKTPSQASSSRPSTPAIPATSSLPQRPTTPLNSKRERPIKGASPPAPLRSPDSSAAVESDTGGHTDTRSGSPVVPLQNTKPTKVIVVDKDTPAVPPGLTPSPGIMPAQQIQRGLSTSGYQMSTQARALLEDVRTRRESLLSAPAGPFPDFDRMLQNLSGGDNEFGGFNFNLDPKLVGSSDQNATLPELEPEPIPFRPGLTETFPPFGAQRPPPPFSPFMPPPGLQQPGKPSYDPPLPTSGLVRQASGSAYTGSFNPFAEESMPRRPSVDDDTTRKVSRFGFARERQGAATGVSATSSPLQSTDSPLYSASDNLPSASSSQPPWPFQRHHDFGPPPGLPLRTSTPSSARASPGFMPQQGGMFMAHQSQQPRFQPFDNSPSELSLKELMGIGRDLSIQYRPAPPPEQGPPPPGPGIAPFSDPAIMSSARYGTPSVSESGFSISTTGETFGSQQQHPGFGPPPGLIAVSQQAPNLASPANVNNVTFQQQQQASLSQSAVSMEAFGLMQSSHASSTISPSQVTQLPPVQESAAESPVLTSDDFPALPTASADISVRPSKPPQPHIPPTPTPHSSANNGNNTAADSVAPKVERKLSKKAQAAADKEKERLAKEKEKEAERERLIKEKDRQLQEKVEEIERLARERSGEKSREKAERLAAQKAAGKGRTREPMDKEKTVPVVPPTPTKVKPQPPKTVVRTEIEPKSAPSAPPSVASSPVKQNPRNSRGTHNSIAAPPEPVFHDPIISKMPKKNKPTNKPVKVAREEPQENHNNNVSANQPPATPAAETRNSPQPDVSKSAVVSEVPRSSTEETAADSCANLHRTDSSSPSPFSLAKLLKQIDAANPGMKLDKHPFFDQSKVNPAAKMPLEYGPLVHALSALSVGGGSFASNMPTGSIDNAVSSFQQLLETLTQTISDLLRLLPRTTWDDSSSFDGVLRDMLKGDDFLDETGDGADGGCGVGSNGSAGSSDRSDEVAALTLALERRARWMEVQLAKLEELHRDINTAAVRAVLAFNDRGWDSARFLPKVDNTLLRFDALGMIEEKSAKGETGSIRPMTIEELEKRLSVAKEATVFAEAEFREAVKEKQSLRPVHDD